MTWFLDLTFERAGGTKAGLVRMSHALFVPEFVPVPVGAQCGEKTGLSLCAANLAFSSA